MKATTQKRILTELHPFTRQYRVDQLYLKTSILSGKWYVDYIPAGTKSLAQNVGDLVISDGTFTEVYPSDSKQQVHTNMPLGDFCNGVRITEKLKSDRDPEFCRRNSEFLKYSKLKGVYLTYSKTERNNQILPIDVEIRELRKITYNKMKATNTTRSLWDYCLVHKSNTRQLLPRDKLQGRTAMEHVAVKIPEISI